MLKPGDIVEVSAAAGIMATLDEGGSLDTPFMPAILQWLGSGSPSRALEHSRTAADGVKELTALDLYEVTLAGVPANPDARVCPRRARRLGCRLWIRKALPNSAPTPSTRCRALRKLHGERTSFVIG